MTYNGRKYSGSTTVVVGDRVDKEDPVDYSFKIYCNLYEYENFYGVSSNIPDFNVANVTWTVTPADIKWNKAPEGAYVTSTVDCTITASYVYNGRTYTDSTSQTAKRVEYTFGIVSDHITDTAACIVCSINTNIPNFRVENVIWTITPATLKGWVEGAQYIIEKSSMTNGESYTLSASYVYDGRTYTDSCTFTCTWGSDNADGYSLSGIHTDGWAGGSAASGFRTEIPDCTSAAVPAAPDRHSRNYAAQ